MTNKQLKAILTMLALPMVDSTRIPNEGNEGCWLSEDECILEAEKLAEKVMGRTNCSQNSK